MACESDHKTCKSKFCPECGDRIGDPIIELLKHVKSVRLSQERRVRKMELRHNKFTKKGSDNPRYVELLMRLHKSINKWTSWQVALEELMAAQTDIDTERGDGR